MNHEGEGIEGETGELGERVLRKTSSREWKEDQERRFLRVCIKTWIHGQFKESVYSKRTVLVVPVHGILFSSASSLFSPLSSSPSPSLSETKERERE